jgi:hypothetical protein
MIGLGRTAVFLRLILRSIAQRCVSKDGAAPWFETPRFARLLTMRPTEAAAFWVPALAGTTAESSFPNLREAQRWVPAFAGTNGMRP